jgi:hypothetical protein
VQWNQRIACRSFTSFHKVPGVNALLLTLYIIKQDLLEYEEGGVGLYSVGKKHSVIQIINNVRFNNFIPNRGIYDSEPAPSFLPVAACD